MANPEHVRIVLDGRDAILRWTQEHPGEALDLRRADFVRQNLNGRPLREANLEWADLRWCDLIETDFSGAKLRRADFHKADMRRAILREAELIESNFEDADLTGADFTKSIFKNTRLLNTMLSAAEGLSHVVHEAPSIIDNETIAKSGTLPREFLVGCGLFVPFQATVYRIVIASPGDLLPERSAVREAIHAWNEQNTRRLRAVLQPVMWEFHATPELGGHPQTIINRQLVDVGDILVCMFWTRLGTPTPEAESGTVEEIRRFLRSRKPVLLYFCKRSLPYDVDTKEMERLKKFRDEIENQGLIDEFREVKELVEKLQRHLTNTVERLTASG